MNKTFIGIPVACVALLTGTFTVYADRVPLTQIPEPVQQAIKTQSGGETLKDVERETRNGQTVYEAEFKRDGINRRVTFGADGRVMPEQRNNLLGRMDRKASMNVNDLPAAVQKAVREQAGGRAVEDIDKETWNGQTVYEVEFKEKGPNSRVYVAVDGSLVVNKDAKSNTYMGAQLSETPAAVQAAVKSAAAGAEVADVDREMEDGQVVYDVEIRQDGLNRHLKIAESGALISDSGNRGSAVGQRVRGVDDRDNGRALDSANTDRSLRNNNVVAMEQLPAPVQKAIRDQGNLGTLKPIKREVNAGRTQYDVEFERDGKNTRLTLNEDGSIAKDNR